MGMKRLIYKRERVQFSPFLSKIYSLPDELLDNEKELYAESISRNHVYNNGYVNL
jgi:hypothetical protein